MEFSAYQKKSRRTAIYPVIGEKYIYPALGLANEAGEVSGKVKKIFRDNEGKLDEKFRKMVAKEMGDVLWYLAQLATDMNLDLDNIAQDNIEWLQGRKKRGTLKGEGDNR